MANINLREWRKELREQRQKEFVMILAVVAAAAAFAVFSWMQQVDGQINTQRSVNRFFEQQIAIQNKQIEEIKTLREEREKLIARMEVIQRLQGDRPIIVRLFDELVRTLPDGVYFESLERDESSITIIGVADKPSSISDLLRNLDASDWFDNSFLRNVNAIKDNDSDETIGNRFTVTVSQSSPHDDTETEGEQ